jgi:DNA-binding LacI/PurR family transcriptional regulator
VVVSEANAQRIREVAKKMDYRPHMAALVLKGMDSLIIEIVIDSKASPDKLEATSMRSHCRSVSNFARNYPK